MSAYLLARRKKWNSSTYFCSIFDRKMNKEFFVDNIKGNLNSWGSIFIYLLFNFEIFMSRFGIFSADEFTFSWNWEKITSYVKFSFWYGKINYFNTSIAWTSSFGGNRYSEFQASKLLFYINEQYVKYIKILTILFKNSWM